MRIRRFDADRLYIVCHIGQRKAEEGRTKRCRNRVTYIWLFLRYHLNRGLLEVHQLQEQRPS